MLARMLAGWLLSTTLTFTFHLPSVDALDSCRVGQAPNTDLESCYVWRQVQGQKAAILYRTRQAGSQGALKSFTDQDTMASAIYWVETSDRAGNIVHLGAACGPNVVQWSRTTAVPAPIPVIGVLEPERWYDVAGRRIEGAPRRSGLYWSSRRGLVAVIR